MTDKPDLDCITLSPSFVLNSIRPLLERESERVKRNLNRARRKGTDATLTLGQWLHILQHYKWRCVFCKGPFETMEHLTRLADGGGTTAGNCVPCCLACNQERGKMAQREKQLKTELTDL